MKKIFAAAFFSFVFLLCVSANAATRTVDTTSDIGGLTNCTAAANDCSLRGAVAVSATGDTINFSSALNNQTITLYSEINITQGIVISGPGANLLTIAGSFNNNRHFYITAGGNRITISGLKLQDGNGGGTQSSLGGSIYNRGGILIDGGTLNAARIAVDNCTAGPLGGGIYNFGILNLSDSSVSNNSANNAAGIYNETGKTAVIQNSSVAGNTASVSSGGIGNNGTLNFYNSTLSGNTAPLGGGSGNGGSANFADSTISGNRATNNKGAGIYNNSGATVQLLNTTITNNQADSFAGAGIWNDNFSSSPVTVRAINTIIAGNISGNGNPVDYVGSISNPGNNLINVGNIGLAPLGNYGGAMQTHALLSNSPALNAGSDCVLTANGCSGFTHSALTTDQRGTNAPRKIGSSVDIGAFERNITFDQNTLPNGSQTQPYSQTLTVVRLTNFAENLWTSEKIDLFNSNNLLAPFTFSLVSIAGQSLPPDLILASNGTISGTPTQTGTFTFTVKATDSDGMASVQTFSMTIVPFNNPPTISGATISRQAGTPVSNSQIATVNDVENGANGVAVTLTSANPSNNVTVSNIVNTNGTVTANVLAGCSATNTVFTLRASDGNRTTDGTLTVNVSANTALTLTYPTSQTVLVNNSVNVSPTAASDNNTITYSLLSVSPALTTAPTINSGGVISIVNAQPAGSYTITVRATDTCGLTTDATLTLNVVPPIKTVTKIADTDDGVCDADCSLREAINAAASGDTILFASPLFDSAQTIALNSELSVNGKNITISGRAANLTHVSGENTSRVFNVGGGSNLTINNLTVKNGFDTTTGGGIYNGATLTVTNSTVSNNSVSGGSQNYGGGIYNASQATLTIRNSTISGNSVTANAIAYGGGIANSNGTLVITNSTVSGNSLGGGNGNSGGGIHSEYGPLTIINDTITANTNVGGGNNYGGGLAIVPDNANLVNTIISGNLAPDVFGSVSNTSNFIGGDARLAPLGYYGGATQTHALLGNSPALNAGNNCVLTLNGCGSFGNPATINDQRGAARIGTVDIGAFESNGSANGGTFRAVTPTGKVNQPFDFQLTANSGAFTYFVSAGALPDGLSLTNTSPRSSDEDSSLAPSAGAYRITGTPTMSGTFNYTIIATNGNGSTATDYRTVIQAAPTAAPVSVSGRISMPNGKGIFNAVVSLTDASGNTRSTRTSISGKYRFDAVEVGQICVIGVQSRGLQFTPQAISVTGDIAGLNFTVIQ